MQIYIIQVHQNERMIVQQSRTFYLIRKYHIVTVNIIAGQCIPNTDEFHSIQEQLDNNFITLKITFHNEV